MKKSYFIIFLTLVTIVTVILFVVLYDKFYGEINNIYIYSFMCFEISFIIISFIHILFLPIANYLYEKWLEFKYKENIDFEYFRDCIKNYSIGTLCVCYNKKVKYKDQFVATLLKLELDKKIITTAKGIEVINEENLSQSERNLIESFMIRPIMYKPPIYTRKNLSRAIKKDSKNDFKMSDLYVEKYNSWCDFIAYINIILYFINFILIVRAEAHLIFAGIWLGLFVSLFLLIYTLSKPYLNKNKKGLEIQYQLIGLRKFLKEYSNIQERRITEIELWDYYIIYGILFDLKGLLDDEANKLYMKYYNLLEML